ncbi:MAG: prepilin peptidase [Kiritimatiellae bacterium]|nr:prepilin peptidase [Kiritimatiellia bacterium]
MTAMPASLYHIYEAFAFMLGACVASFLNVVIYRVPKGESIVSPPSHCPGCGAQIKWWQNIPILSWILLRGRCASCKMRISPRYVLVELLGGILFLAAFIHVMGMKELYVGRFAVLLVWWIWISLMIAGSFIDFDHQLLPDFVTVGGMVLGVVYWLLFTFSFGNFHPDFANPRMYMPIAWSLSGLACGFGILWLVRFLGTKAFRREAMGMGDVFLLGAIGAIFGPVATIFVLIFSSVFGSIVGLGMIALSKAKLGRFVAIPFGPYICAACLLWMFRGPEIVRAYIRLVT